MRAVHEQWSGWATWVNVGQCDLEFLHRPALIPGAYVNHSWATLTRVPLSVLAKALCCHTYDLLSFLKSFIPQTLWSPNLSAATDAVLILADLFQGLQNQTDTVVHILDANRWTNKGLLRLFLNNISPDGQHVLLWPGTITLVIAIGPYLDPA